MKKFCNENNIFVKNCCCKRVYELQKRAEINGVETQIITEEEVLKALFSPNTASVDPKEVCYKLRDILKEKGVDFFFNTSFEDCNLEYK